MDKIVISNVKIKLVLDNEYEYMFKKEDIEEVCSEDITFKTIIAKNGDMKAVGMTEKVKETIGPIFEYMEILEGLKNHFAEDLGRYYSECEEYKNASFLKRLKYLFTSRI